MTMTTLICIGLALGQVAVEPSPLADQVRELVVQLNDDDLARRQQAEKDLVALGPDAIELLPPVRDRMPQELKLRLQRVREMLEKQAAEAATRPTLVTLQGTFRLSEVVAAIEKQTGNRLLDYRGQFGQAAADPELTLELDRQPFWVAWEAVMDQAGLQLYPYSGELRTLAFVDRPPNTAATAGRVAHSGLFRFEPTRIEAIRDLRAPDVQGMRLTLEVAWEPRITPIAITQPIESLQVQGDNGATLDVSVELGDLEAAVQNTVGAVEIDIPFDLPTRDMRAIQQFHGSILVLLPGREVTFTFAELAEARNVPQRRAGATVVLQAVRQNVDVQEVRILVQFDEASGALESHRGWVYNNEAYLLDPAGKRVDYSSFETTRQQPNEVGLSYKFAGPVDLAGYQFIYKSPAAIVRTPVNYQLQNIPLP